MHYLQEKKIAYLPCAYNQRHPCMALFRKAVHNIFRAQFRRKRQNLSAKIDNEQCIIYVYSEGQNKLSQCSSAVGQLGVPEGCSHSNPFAGNLICRQGCPHIPGSLHQLIAMKLPTEVQNVEPVIGQGK